MCAYDYELTGREGAGDIGAKELVHAIGKKSPSDEILYRDFVQKVSWECAGLAADAWNGTYRSLGQAFRENTEDTFMWRDPRGRLHALFHDMQPTTTRHVGGHAFSVDGLHWNYSSVGAYNSTVALVSGGSFTYKRRERPHLLLDKAGNPAYLTNGVVPGVAADWSFTGVYAIRGGGGG